MGRIGIGIDQRDPFAALGPSGLEPLDWCRVIAVIIRARRVVKKTRVENPLKRQVTDRSCHGSFFFWQVTG